MISEYCYKCRRSPSKAAWGSLNEIGKAVASIDANGDVNTISVLMGERHKVRNFYNNIYSPNSLFGDVTIDTHAVAAGLLRPLSGNSLEVDHNFKNTSVKVGALKVLCQEYPVIMDYMQRRIDAPLLNVVYYLDKCNQSHGKRKRFVTDKFKQVQKMWQILMQYGKI